MPLFQWFRPVVGTICPSSAAAVVGPPRASQGMKKGRRPRRRPRLKLSDRAGPDQCPVPGENALFPAQIAGFLAVSRPVPVYPVFLKYVVSVQKDWLVPPIRSPAGVRDLQGIFYAYRATTSLPLSISAASFSSRNALMVLRAVRRHIPPSASMKEMPRSLMRMRKVLSGCSTSWKVR